MKDLLLITAIYTLLTAALLVGAALNPSSADPSTTPMSEPFVIAELHGAGGLLPEPFVLGEVHGAGGLLPAEDAR